MNGATANPALDPAVQVARDRENVVVGDQIVRHRLATRVVHWSTAFFFFVALGCGLPIYSPVFGWLAHLFGGLAVCRWLHPWTGIAFTAFTAVMFVQWVGDMKLERSERGWLGRKLVQYLRHEGDDPDVGNTTAGRSSSSGRPRRSRSACSSRGPCCGSPSSSRWRCARRRSCSMT